MSINEINALITLIDDPDEGIFTQVKSEIKSYGEIIIPYLGHYRDTHRFGELFKNRIEDLINDIHVSVTENALKEWIKTDDKDLFEALLIINQYQYPTLDSTELKREVWKVRKDVWIELNENLTALENIHVFNHILYKEYGFAGNRQNYTAPQNSFLSDLLQTKKGNPLALSMLYQILANSLEIPVFGVNLPNHFILAYMDESALHLHGANENGSGVLFYINPFSEGAIIHKNEIDDFISHLNLPQKAAYYSPCSNVDMMCRMMNNLIFSFTQLNEGRKAEDMKRLLAVLSQ